MKRFIFIFLILIPSFAFGTYTEFYCQSGGSNLNAGSTTNNTAAYTSTNGGWSTVTNTFTPSDTQSASLVNVGDWASVYIDGASVAVMSGRITTVNSSGGNLTSLVISTTSRIGTAPTTSATTRTCKVGGAWLGPNGASGFPLNLSSLGQGTDASSHPTRINLKNNQTYSISAQISDTSTNHVIQGYSSSVGDGGKATIDGSTNVIKLLAMTGQGTQVSDVKFLSTAASGSSDIASDTNGTTWFRCIFTGSRTNGLNLGSSASVAIECEAYGNNTSNTSAKGGFSLALVGAACHRCVSHDNTGSNSAGFVLTSGAGMLTNCIADTNGGKGINVSSGSNGARVFISECDLYNNGSDGIAIATTSNLMVFHIENCNLIKNTGAGINITSTAPNYVGFIFNVGYGAGTQANGSADTIGNLEQSGSVTYASNVTPWVDPANGNFSNNLAASQGVGRGAFTETAASYAGTVGFPDISAAQANIGVPFPTPTATPTATPVQTSYAFPQ